MRTTCGYSSASRSAGAFLTMLLGGLFMVLIVVSLSKSVDKKEDTVKQKTRIVTTKKIEEKIVKREKPKEISTAKRTQTAPKAPPPDIGAMIGGIEMNIPEFNTAGIEGDSRELLDDLIEDAIMSEETVDVKPQVIHRADIDYPADAAKENIQGYVVVHLLIAKDGTVQLAKVLEAEPQGVFEKTVLNGIRDWRFTSARYKGEPVQVWVKQKISFNR